VLNSTIEDQKKNYREKIYALHYSYVEGVLSGSIVVNKDIYLAVKRYLKDMNNTEYYINYSALDKFFNFLFYINIDNNKNQYIQFVPENWQAFYFFNIYGFYWKNESSKRRFIRSFLTISRKNGKSTLAIIQALYHLTKENINAKVYVVSESKNMSEESSLSIAKNIISNSPALLNRVQQLQYSLRYIFNKSISTFKMLPFKPSAMNSLKPSFAIVDELHLMPDSQVVDKLASGMGATPNPLLSIIGTRGNNSTFYQYELEQVYKKVLDNKLNDESSFIMMFGQDNENEVNNVELWVKSNPNLHSTLSLNYLLDIFDKAKLTPSSLKEFFSFNLNIWVDSIEDQFIESEFINEAFEKGNKPHKYRVKKLNNNN
jgi:phage terminase large subunit-like protein